MNKLLLAMSIACCSLAVQAQMIDNQRPVGTTYTSQLPDGGTGNPASPGHFTVLTAVPMPQFEKVGNARIVGVRFGLNQSIGATTVHIAPVIYGATSAQIFDDVAQASVTTTADGWNYVTLDQPLLISDFEEASALLVGYEYDQVADNDKAYPLYVDDNVNEFGLLYLGAIDGKDGIYDFSPSGSLCAQFIVEGDIPDYDVVSSGFILDKCAMKVGEKGAVMVNMFNYGRRTVQNLALDVLIDGQKVGSLSQKSIGTEPKNYIFYPEIPADLKPGVHQLAIKAAKVGNTKLEANLDDDVVTLPITAITDAEIMPRDKYLVEQFTSVDCTWCPRGSELLQQFCEAQPDATVVAVHGNMSSTPDPFYSDQTQALIKKLGIRSFPTCALNRICFDDASYALNISHEKEDYEWVINKLKGYLAENSEVCIAPINTNAMITESGRAIEVTVKGKGTEYLRDVLSDCALNIYIVENGLVSRQSFPNGGVERNYTHNNVLRQVVTSIDGDKIHFLNNSEYRNEYTVVIPPNWRTKNLEVVAFITRKTDYIYGTGVINANREPVQSYVEAIPSVEATRTVDVPTYDISGRAATVPTSNAGRVVIRGNKKMIY